MAATAEVEQGRWRLVTGADRKTSAWTECKGSLLLLYPSSRRGDGIGRRAAAHASRAWHVRMPHARTTVGRSGVGSGQGLHDGNVGGFVHTPFVHATLEGGKTDATQKGAPTHAAYVRARQH
jgi:hypothetical protein